MDSDILKDLKQLDERLEKAEDFLKSSACLFDKYYSEHTDKYRGNFCWPYTIWAGGRPDWASYRLPKPHLSVITSAMCGWAIAKYILRARDVPKRLRDVPGKVAKTLARLKFRRLKSRTFPEETHIFVQAEVLRFLASQAQWESELADQLLTHLRKTMEWPEYPFRAWQVKWKISKVKAKGKGQKLTRAAKGEKKLHPFFLYYCVLALEQVQTPAVKLANTVIRLYDLQEKLAGSGGLTSWPGTVTLLERVKELRETLDSLAVVIRGDLLQADLARKIESDVSTLKEPLGSISSAIRDKNKELAKKSLSAVRKVLDNCAQRLAAALQKLPVQIREHKKVNASWSNLRKVAHKIREERWYGDALRNRLHSEILSQISYAACNDFSRLDIGALTYSLAAALRCKFINPLDPEAVRGIAVVFEHQRSGRWTQIMPIKGTAQGTVHLPLNMEIANALLSIIRDRMDAGVSCGWTEIDQAMDWLRSMFNPVGKDGGWCTEYDYSPDRIDTYVTAQVVQFLWEYIELRRQLVVQSALDRAGLVPIRHDKVNVTWEGLQPSDLQQPYDNQIKNEIRNRFLDPWQQGRKVRPCSLLLYGPPGTSKTSIMEALAHKLGWQFLAISPADFLAAGGDQVEARSSLMFEILSHAKDLVVLFDEVDELLMDRDAPERPKGIFRFMTTSMLPKLQSLRTKGNIIFGLATNYQERLDKAITRQGRVDFDWVVLPPDFTSRMVLVAQFARKASKSLRHGEARSIAAKSVFFAYLELRKVIETDPIPDDPRVIVPHPTSDPETYARRPRGDEELQALLKLQITDPVVKYGKSYVIEKVAPQLAELLRKEDFFDEKTIQEVKEKQKKIKG